VQPLSLLGSTGSIGTQTLDIIEEFPDKFKLVALAAGSNVELLAEQVRHVPILHTGGRGLGWYAVEGAGEVGAGKVGGLLTILFL
jgi:hypothetical protein